MEKEIAKNYHTSYWESHNSKAIYLSIYIREFIILHDNGCFLQNSSFIWSLWPSFFCWAERNLKFQHSGVNSTSDNMGFINLFLYVHPLLIIFACMYRFFNYFQWISSPEKGHYSYETCLQFFHHLFALSLALQNSNSI